MTCYELEWETQDVHDLEKSDHNLFFVLMSLRFFLFLQKLTLMSHKPIFRFLHAIQILLLPTIVLYYNFRGSVQYRQIKSQIIK